LIVGQLDRISTQQVAALCGDRMIKVAIMAATPESLPSTPASIAPIPIRIDFVSDVSCPWCAVGLKSLEQAVDRIGDRIAVDLHFQPFELNPQMSPEGQDATEHLVQKYGLTRDQLERNREVLRARGAALGFVFNARGRVYNTFDAHRLLHWAALESTARERALKHALLRAYFTDGEDVSSHDVLARLAGEVGLDATRARAILSSDAHAADVRSQERHYTEQGIHAVPSVIINGRHLIQGGQPVEAFEDALRQIARLNRSDLDQRGDERLL
jgi:predicted DsbA family dithiol-disulfide isomerase